MSVKKDKSRFEHFKTSQEMKFACKRYFSSVSTENDSSSSLFTKSAFKCTSEVNPFAPGDFAEKCVLKLVEWFSGPGCIKPALKCSLK